MKIVCDNCATKYSIADDKVRGKVFKIRCKKCSHIIVVRGTEGGDAQPAELSAEASLPDMSAVTASPDGATDSVWHLVIDREQVGPMTPAEVRGKFAAGQVDVETYAWREGFGDWLRLGSIDVFSDLGSAGANGQAANDGATMLGAEIPAEVAALAARGAEAVPSPRGSDSADVFKQQSKQPADDGAGDLFGNAGATQAATPASFAAASSGEDLFGGSQAATQAASSAPAAMFGSSSSPAASEAPRERSSSPGYGTPMSASSVDESADAGAKMTGQRNENSVLFSLNNLQALATGGAGGGASKASSPSPSPGYANSKNDGSGLIDIRAMAAQTLSASPQSSSGDVGVEMPVMSSAPIFSSVVAAPIMMPTQPSGMPKWVWGVVGGGVLAVSAVVVLLVVVLTRKPPEQPPLLALNTPPPVVAAAALPATPPPAVAAPAAVVAAPPADAPKADAPAGADKSKHDGKTAAAPGSHHEHSASSGKKDEAAPPAAAEKPAAVAPVAAAPKETAKKKGGDDLDSLLDGATGGKSDSPKHAAAQAPADDDPNLPEQLGRADIVAAMQPSGARTKACYEQFKVPGTAMVKISIAKSGKVQSAVVGGALSGTPTGDCVARIMKGTAFKKFKGATMTIDWPVMLR